MKKILPVLFLSFVANQLFCQTTWTLQKCVETAQKNSISIQNAHLMRDVNEISLNTDQMSRLPSLNGNVNNNYNFGRSIDPFSNSFVTTGVTSLTMNLNTSVRLFKGFQYSYNIRRSEMRLASSVQDVEKVKNDIALDVTALYLTVLLSKEQVTIAKNNLQQSQNQSDRIEIMIEAGVSTVDKRLEIQAQISNDKSTLVAAENSLTLSMLSLQNYLNIELEGNFEIAELNTDEMPLDYTLISPGDLLETNYARLPQYKSGELSVESAELALKSALCERLPTINLGANLNTLYSSQSRSINGTQIDNVVIGQVETSGENVISQKTTYDLITPGIGDQFSNNFGQSIGVSMSIPIFNRNTINSAIQNAEVQQEQAEINLQNIRNQIKNTVYQSYYNMVAAKKAYEAAIEQVNSQQLLFNQTEVRYNAGAVSYFDWLLVRNNVSNALINLLRSRYDYLFKTKTFEFYLGSEKISNE